MGRLDGKVAIVTGAAGGIGEVTCDLFVSEGAKVVIVDFDGEKANALADKINADKKDSAIAVKADLTSADDRQMIFDKTLEAFGKVDILLNNAGWGCKQPFLETTEADFDRSINLNMKATYFMIQLACKQMIKQGTGGRIVSTASTAAFQGERNGSIYSGTKHGIISFTKGIALEMGEYGINVNCIAPGFTRTGNNSHIPSSIDENFLTITPTKRINGPIDIANGYLMLCLEETRQITAQVIPIDGGYSGTRMMNFAQNSTMQVK